MPNSWIGSVPSSWTIRISALDAHALRDLLDRDLQHQRAGARAAVLLGERQGEDVLLGEEPADVPRVLARRVDVGRARADALVDDLTDRVPEVLVLLGQVVDVAHGRRHASIVVAGLRAGAGVPRSHGPGNSLFLIAVGAILRYAVSDSLEGIDIPTIGLILMIVGIVGLLISLFTDACGTATAVAVSSRSVVWSTPRPVVSRPVRLIA